MKFWIQWRVEFCNDRVLEESGYETTNFLSAGFVTVHTATIRLRFHDNEGFYPQWGRGGETCGQWVDARNDAGSVTASLYQNWLDGFVSAAVWYGGPIESMHGAAFYVWMDNFCQKNPLIGLNHGARALVKELIERHNN